MILHVMTAAGLFVSGLALGYSTPQKMVGATNLAVTDGEPYEFRCNPLDAQIFVNEKGEIFKKAKKSKKLSSGLSDFAAGEYVEYLECFVIGEELVAAFKQSNGPDANITVRRKRLTGKGLTWNISILGLNLRPPTFAEPILIVPVDDARLEIDVEKGEVVKTDAKGCVKISRFPKTASGVHRSVGAGCAESGAKAEAAQQAK